MTQIGRTAKVTLPGAEPQEARVALVTDVPGFPRALVSLEGTLKNGETVTVEWTEVMDGER